MTSVDMAIGANQADQGESPGLIARIWRASLTWKVLSVSIFALIWEIAARSGFNFAFPTFTATMAALWEMIADGSMGGAFLRTMEPLAIGLIISLSVGISAGIAMGLRQSVEWFTLPMFIVMQAAPMAALIPLVTFVYGIGLASKVVAVVMLSMPVIAMNSYKAVRNVPPSLVSMCHSFTGNRWQQIWLIILPAASPMMFAGLRLGVAEGFSGAVLAELLITPTGVGDLITYHRSVANFAHMYATILAIVLFAIIAVSALQWVEAKLFRPERRGS